MTNVAWLTNFKRRLARSARHSRTGRRSGWWVVPKLMSTAETLEDRALLATITVTSLANNYAVDSQVTLLEAVDAAEFDVSVDGSVAGNGADVIEFAPSLFLGGSQISLLPSMVLNAQNLSAMAVSTDITVLGPAGEYGLTLAMNDIGRHFDVLATGKLTLERLTLTGGNTLGGNNSVIGRGGAIFNAGELTIRGSLFHANSVVGGNDGGAYGGAIFNEGTLNIVNSTFATNTATGGAQVMGTGPGEGLGGAIFNRNGTVEITNSTFSGNVADEGAVYALGDAAPVAVNTTNSIFANTTNAAAANVSDVTIAVSNGGTVSSAAWSGVVLEQGQIDGVPVTSHGMLGIQVVDPQLEGLRDNGGPVATIAPMAGSPVINTGINQQVVDDGFLVDGRGYLSRVEGIAVDVGAYEVGADPQYVAQFGAVTSNSGEASSGLGDTDFVIPAGSQRLLVVTVVDTNAPGTLISSVALDGEALALVGESLATGVRTAVYVLPLGSSLTDSMSFLNVEWNQNVDGVYFTQLFRGVHQFGPVGNVVTNQSVTASADLTDGELAYSAFAANGGAGTMIADAQQVSLQTGVFSGAQAFISTKTTTGNTSLSYGNLAGETGLAHVAFDLQSAYVFNPDAPRISTIVRQSPTAQVTSDSQVTFRVTFNEPVQNVSAEDFKVMGAAAANNGASVISVTAQSATQYDVVVNVDNNANGTLGLGSSVLQNIIDLANTEFVGTIESSETYRIDNAAPVLLLGTGVLGIEQFEVQVTADENATLKYLLKLATDPVPTATEISTAPTGTVGVSGQVTSTIPFAGLTEETNYVVYLIATDAFAQESGVESIGIATLGVETTVALVNGMLVITDSNHGNSDDQLTIDYALGSYVITDPHLILTTAIVGATGDRTHSVTIPDTGVTGLRFELADGADELSVNSLPTSLPSGFSVNGGTGDTATIAAEVNTAGANIEINADFVNLQHNLKTTAAGQIAVTALRSIHGVTSKITTDTGAISLSANSAKTAASGTFGGIHLESSSITTTLGAVELIGKSGNAGTANEAFGVWLQATTISTSSTGTGASGIIVDGRTQQGAGGPAVRFDASNLNAIDGHLTVFGFATAGTGSTLSNSKFQITGAGSIDLRGSSDVQSGIVLSNAQLVTTTGTVGVNGLGAVTGLIAQQAELTTDSGDVLVTAHGTTNGVDLTQSKITNASGDVIVNASGASGFGFRAGSTTSVSTTSGDITLSAAGIANGIEISMAQVSSTSGNIRLSTDRLQLTPVSTTISGTGHLQIDALTSATSIGVGNGSGTLQISGAELGTLSDGFAQITIGAIEDSSAIEIDNAVFTDNVAMMGSQISVTRLNAGMATVGLLTTNGAIIDGDTDTSSDIVGELIALRATAGIGTASNSLEIRGALVAAETNVGDIALTNSRAAQIGSVQPTGFATAVESVRILDASNDNSGADDIILNNVGTLTVTKAIHNLDGGNITIDVAPDEFFVGELKLEAVVVTSDGNGDIGLSGFDVSLADEVISVGSGRITITGARSVQLEVGSSLATVNGDITIAANTSVIPVTSSVDAIVVSGSKINTVLGDISLHGVAGDQSGVEFGVGVRILESTIQSMGTGNAQTLEDNSGVITLIGEGRNGSASSTGVAIGQNTLISVIDSDIVVQGTSTHGRGVTLDATSKFESTGTLSFAGKIDITGVSAEQNGVLIDGHAIAENGSLQIAGTATSAELSAAVKVAATATVKSNFGPVGLTGTATTTTLHGVETAGTITAANGLLTMTGSTENVSGSGLCATTGQIGSENAPGVTLIADTIDLAAGDMLLPVDIVGTGTLTFVPLTNTTSIGINSSGTLNLTPAELLTIGADFDLIVFGSPNASTGAVSVHDVSFQTNVGIAGGTISVTKLNAATHEVRLAATTGAISDNGDDAADVTASSLVLNAATGIGDDSNPLDIQVGQLAGSTNSGDIAVSNTGDLTLTELAGVVGVRIEDSDDDDSHNDNVSITTNGHLIVAKSIVNLDAGDITLEAALAMTGDLTLSAIVMGRNFNFAAADDVILNVAPGSMSGDLRIVAGTNSPDGNIVQAGGINIASTTGTITLAVDGDLVIESLSSSSHVTLRSEGGSILEDGDDEIDISVSTIGLEAKTGIGTDADDIDLSVLHLGAVTDSGDIHLGFTGDVTIDLGNGLNGVVEGVRILDSVDDDSGNDNIRLTTDSKLAVTTAANLDGGQIVLTSITGTTLLGASTLSRLQVNGPLSLDGLLALDGLSATNGNEILVANDGADHVSGRFTGRPESNFLTVDSHEYFLTYYGGDGNDIALVARNLAVTHSGTESADVFEVRRFLSGDADSIQTLLSNNVIDSRPFVANPVVNLSGNGGDDLFVLNYSGGGGYYTATAIINGGNGVDRIAVNGNSVDRVEPQLGGVNLGSVSIVPVEGSSSITWSFEQSEVVDLNLTTKMTTMTLSAAADTVTLSAMTDLDMELATSSGVAYRMLNPQQALAIYGGLGNDSITLQSVDAGFLGSLFVDAGDGSDIINASTLTRQVGEVGGLGHDTIIGSQGFDSISGGAGNDVITANGGDDLITGGRGNDTVSGGSGDDGMYWAGGDGNDVIDGNAGTDEVGISGAENSAQGERIEVRDSSGRVAVERFTDPGINPFLLSLGTVETIEIFAFSGDDLIDARNLTLAGLSIDAGDGADVVYGGALADVLIGGLGQDTIRAGGGHDVLLGGGDSDLLDGEAGDDRVRGQGASLDVLIGGLGTDTIDGGDGTDIAAESGDQNYVLTNMGLTGTLTGVDSFVAIEDAALTGGSSSNIIDASSFTGRTTLSGGAGHDTLQGGSNVDFISGDDGDDVILSGSGNDNINGFAGNDSVDAGLGNDLIRGGAGRDSLTGGEGDDRLFGQGTSSDLLVGGSGNDTLSGGTGDDLLSGDTGDDVFVWEDGDGTDSVDGGSGTDRQMVYASKASSEGDQITVTDNGVRISLTRAAGTLVSGFLLNLGTVERINVLLYAGNDVLDAGGLTLARLNVQGGGGNDTLNGGSQNDVLVGDFGNDLIHGGAGVDFINAGGGADTVDGGLDGDTVDVSNADAIDTVLNSALDTVFSNVDDILN